MTIADYENVARALFSPRMIIDGQLQPEAFRLRPTIHEDYISVMRMSVESWKNDVASIPERKDRILYGYAEMNVGEIRNIKLNDVIYDVKDCGSENHPSHAGIFISVKGENLIGGKMLESVETASEQEFLLLAIQRELVDIAQKNIHKNSFHS